MERLIYHVDVNSAYLSWEATEQLKNGAEIDIRDIPAIIGGGTARRKGWQSPFRRKPMESGPVSR